MGTTVELTWKDLKTWGDLTQEEQAEVRTAFNEASREEELRYRSDGLIRELETLKIALEKLSVEARAFLLTEDELAAAYEGEPMRRSHLEEVEGRLLEQLEWLTISEQGRPLLLARRAVIVALRKIWVEAGGDPAPGRLYADKKKDETFSPNAFVSFLGHCLTQLDKELKDEKPACHAAHSILHALKKDDRALAHLS